MYIKVRILVVVYNKILYSPMGFSMTSIQTGGNVGLPFDGNTNSSVCKLSHPVYDRQTFYTCLH